MATVRELLTKWTFSYDSGKLKALEGQLQGIRARLDAFAGAKAAQALYQMADRFSKVGEEIEIASSAAGVGVVEFQKLAFAAKQNNIEMGEVQSSMARLARSLYGARNGAENFATAFRELGIDRKQLMGFKDAQAALYGISDRLNKIQDPIKRAALAQQLLGRGSVRMVNMLAKGSKSIKDLGNEAQRLGIILSVKQVANLDNLENTLQKFGAFMHGIFARVSADVAPVLEKLVNEMLAFYNANRKVIESNIQDFLENLAFTLGFLWGAFKLVSTAIIDFAKRFHFENKLLSTISLIGTLAGVILFLGTALSIVGTAVTGLLPLFKVLQLGIAAALSPILLNVLAITAAVVGLQAIIQYFRGQKSWLQEGMEYGKGLIGGDKGGAGGIGGFDEMRKNASPQAAAPGSQNSAFTINAPMNFNVPEGTNPQDVGKAAYQAITDTLGKLMRETDRSITPVRAF